MSSNPALIDHLRELATTQDRAALAALRRSAGKLPGTFPDVYRHIVPFIPAKDDQPSRSWAYFSVAALFALHPVSADRAIDMGAAYGRLKESPSRDSRFQSLLSAEATELPTHLRHAIRLFAASEKIIAINWATLLGHLLGWSHPDRYVQRRWARSYWAPIRHSEQAKSTEQ